MNTKTTIEKWVSATEELSDVRVEFPIVADSDAVIASTLGLVRHGQPPHPTGVLHASMVLIVNPNNRVELIQQYPEAVGRNFHEVLRAVDALDMTFLNNHVSCGGNWASGEDVFINNDVEPIRPKVCSRAASWKSRLRFRLAPSPKLDILDAAITAVRRRGRSQTPIPTTLARAHYWSLCDSFLGFWGLPPSSSSGGRRGSRRTRAALWPAPRLLILGDMDRRRTGWGAQVRAAPFLDGFGYFFRRPGWWHTLAEDESWAHERARVLFWVRLAAQLNGASSQLATICCARLSLANWRAAAD